MWKIQFSQHAHIDAERINIWAIQWPLSVSHWARLSEILENKPTLDSNSSISSYTPNASKDQNKKLNKCVWNKNARVVDLILSFYSSSFVTSFCSQNTVLFGKKQFFIQYMYKYGIFWHFIDKMCINTTGSTCVLLVLPSNRLHHCTDHRHELAHNQIQYPCANCSRERCLVWWNRCDLQAVHHLTYGSHYIANDPIALQPIHAKILNLCWLPKHRYRNRCNREWHVWPLEFRRHCL